MKPWVVDTSVLLDIRLQHPSFGWCSARCLRDHLAEGLVISPITYVELAPTFAGDAVLQHEFLARVGVNWREAWTFEDTRTANRLWAEYVFRKRAGTSGKRPMADLLIEAFALRFRGLITRNPKHFRLESIVVPE